MVLRGDIIKLTKLKPIACMLMLLLLPKVGMTMNCDIDTVLLTTGEGMLRSSLLKTNLNAPKQDAKKRAHLNDYRLLATRSFSGTIYPGLKEIQKKYICKGGRKLLNGITDGYNSLEHITLADKVKGYAAIYNIEMIRLIEDLLQK